MSKIGLIVDKSKPGYVSTIDGDTAKSFFSSPDLSAETTDIEKESIVNFALILRVLVSKSKI